MERGKDAMMLSELLLRDARADASTAKGADEVQSVHPSVVPVGGTSMRRIRRSRRATNVRMRKARAAAVRLFWSQSRADAPRSSKGATFAAPPATTSASAASAYSSRRRGPETTAAASDFCSRSAHLDDNDEPDLLPSTTAPQMSKQAPAPQRLLREASLAASRPGPGRLRRLRRHPREQDLPSAFRCAPPTPRRHGCFSTTGERRFPRFCAARDRRNHRSQRLVSEIDVRSVPRMVYCTVSSAGRPRGTPRRDPDDRRQPLVPATPPPNRLQGSP